MKNAPTQAARHPQDGPWPPARFAVLLAAAALVLRIVVILWRRDHDPLFHQFINDAALYEQWARALADGGAFGAADAPYFLPPTYPQLLSVLFRLTGNSPWAVTWFQTACGTGTILGILILGHRLHGRRAGLAAGVVALLSGPLLWYEGWFLPSTLNIFLLVVSLNLALSAVDFVAGRRVWWVLRLLLGFALGLAVTNRPQNALLLILLAGWLVLSDRRTLAPAWRGLVILAAGAMIAIGPVALHNLRTGGEEVAVSANGGFNFYLGNFTGAEGRYAIPPGFPGLIGDQPQASRDLAASHAGRPLTWREASDFWFGAGRRELAADPGRALRLGWRKFRLALAWREMENNFVAGWVHTHLGPGRWTLPSLGLLWLLALPALMNTVRRPRARDWPGLLLIAATLAVCLMFWVSTRIRLPLVIPLAVFAGASLTHRSLWLRPAVGAGMLLFALLVFWPTGDREGAAFMSDLGRVHAQRGDIVAARSAFAEALAIEPGFPMALNGVALTYMDEGNPARAIALLEQLLRKHPDFELARRNLQAIRQYESRRRAKP